jgi:hypothetical protein
MKRLCMVFTEDDDPEPSEDDDHDHRFPFHFRTLDNIDDLKHEGDAVWGMDVETGSGEHGVRMHVNHPREDEWRDMEMTGHFKLIDSEDQII